MAPPLHANVGRGRLSLPVAIHGSGCRESRAPRLLPSYPSQLSQRAKETLRELSVDVRTDSMVTSVEPGAVASAGWRIPTDTVA